jgi:hypothetical protein
MPRNGGGRPHSSVPGKFTLRSTLLLPGTLPLFGGEALLTDAEGDVSPALRYVIGFIARALADHDLPCSSHKKLYMRFLQIIINLDGGQKAEVLNSVAFQKRSRYLKSRVQPRWPPDRLELFSHMGAVWSIMNGCRVHLEVASILLNHGPVKIDDILMDTFWLVMRDYVTAIIVAVSRNTAIPRAVAFCRIENCELSNIFYNVLMERCNMDLKDLTLLSDQGSELRKCEDEHNLTRWFCFSFAHGSCFRIYVLFWSRVNTSGV